MAPYGIKSVFVPANLLRDEIRVGYQEGGDGEASPVDEAPVADETPVEKNPTFEEPEAAEDAPMEGAETEETAAEDAGDGAQEPDEVPVEEAATVGTQDATDDSFDKDNTETGVDAPLEKMLPNLRAEQAGGYDDMEAFDSQIGGGVFSSGPDVFNIMRTMLTSSATGASMPDLFEDAVYETTIIKGHLDSIAQSLAIIAAKYAGPGSTAAADSQGNGRNRGRGDRGGRGRQGRGDQWSQDPELPETPPAWEEDLAAAE